MNHSESINELIGALAKARGSFQEIKKTESNPFFKSKYADLANVINSTFKALSENGLAVIQSPGDVSNGSVVLSTMLAHSSGQWIKEEITMPIPKVDPQGVGSAITYGRRYALQSILNISADADDDGNAASAAVPVTAHQYKPPADILEARQASPSPDELTGIFEEDSARKQPEKCTHPPQHRQPAGVSKNGKPYKEFCRLCKESM